MGISIVRFEQAKQPAQWGIILQDQIAVLKNNYPSHRELMDDCFTDSSNFSTDGLPCVPRNEANFLSPINKDVQIFCQGLNYASHREEGGVNAAKGKNLIFSKPPSTICGPHDDIIRPKGCELLDYEIELALILKQDLPPNTGVTSDNLLDYVGAFTLANDVSARDFMFGAPMMQWFKGKGHRTFCPTGPVLHLLDACDRTLLSNLHLTLSLNGEIRQDATTDQLIFKPEETLTELSSFADINKGDMLLTGTPGGVILNANLKVGLALLLNFTNDEKRGKKLLRTQKSIRYLQPGDSLTLSLESRDGSQDFGTQTTGVRDATCR